MRVPFLPIAIDEFCAFEGVSVYFLSHFHTDHLRGLTPSWANGIIYTSPATRALLIERFGDDIGRRTVAVPFGVFASLPLRNNAHADVELCLVPANHIPGSAMFYFKTFVGTILFTGDFKFDASMEKDVASFFANNPVDHLWIDDTWLHLSSRTSKKLLSQTELETAFEAISRRVRSDAARFELQQSAAPTDDLEQILRLRSRTASFVVRCYLHNHFGKEPLVQLLAKKLGTRIEVDDKRYGVLAALASVAENCEVDLSVFEPSSRYEQAVRVDRSVDDEALCVVTSGPPNPCGVVIVNSRADIHPTVLEEASKRSGGVPHFAVIMSGWAKLQPHEASHSNVFQVPYTLHCSPDQVIRFTQMLKPRSVSPIHYRRSRAVTMMVHLGPYLRTPFTNEVLSASALAGAVVPLGLRDYVMSNLPAAPGSDLPKSSRVRPREEPPQLSILEGRAKGVRIGRAPSTPDEDQPPLFTGNKSLSTFLDFIDASDDDATADDEPQSTYRPLSRVAESVLLLSQ